MTEQNDAETIDFAAVKAEHKGRHTCSGWLQLEVAAGPPCLPYRLAVEGERLAAKVARIRIVRARVTDHVQWITEGSLISRLKVDTWLEAALSDEQEK